MDNSLYVGLSKQLVLQRQMDIIANNIANADTSGFKVEQLAVAEYPQAPAFTLGGPAPVKFVMPNGVIRDFGQGALRKTDSPFDVAVDGQGFFRVQTPAGERYTRDGRFRADEAGRLVTQGGERIGKLGVVSFANLSTLEKTGDNLMKNTSNQAPTPVADPRLRQGMLEGSNVNPILEITKMIEVSRSYERMARMMDSQNDLSTQAVQQLGKAA